MRVEIPYFSRCCCCLPLRKGILIMAYITFVISTLLSALFIRGDIGIRNWYQHKMSLLNQNNGMYEYSYHGLISFCRLLAALYILNAVLSIVLITGCHKKSVKLIKMYYDYGIFQTPFLFGFLLLHVDYLDFFFLYEVGGVSTLWLFFEGYFLLLIRSEIKKLTEENICVRYENSENKLAATVDNAVDTIYDKIYCPTVFSNSELLKNNELQTA